MAALSEVGEVTALGEGIACGKQSNEQQGASDEVDSFSRHGSAFSKEAETERRR
jgi:hypothetical protein